MTASQAHLRDLFAGPFPGHALLFSRPHPPAPRPGDFLTAEGDLAPWVEQLVAAHEAPLEWHEALADNSVPQAEANPGTGLLAAAFGCPAHVSGEGERVSATVWAQQVPDASTSRQQGQEERPAGRRSCA